MQHVRQHTSGEVRVRGDDLVAEGLDAVLGSRPRARILIEASTDSEWVARRLEGRGGDLRKIPQAGVRYCSATP